MRNAVDTIDRPPPSYIGQMAGLYRIVRKLDEGAMGTVYEAVQEVPGTQVAVRVAVKVMTHALAASSRYVERFLTEVQLASQLHHPGIVQIVGFGKLRDDTPYLAMEFLEGMSLARHLTAEREKNKGLPPSFVLPIAHQIAVAMAVAHERQIVHRDLKPSNVMLLPSRSSPGGWQVKIIDFGVAKKLDDELASPVIADAEPGIVPGSAERSSTVYGTPMYMAPESGLRNAPLDPRIDVYAFGVMLYEMLAGEPPFSAASATGILAMHSGMTPAPLRQRTPRSPRLLVELVHRMLAKQVQERPSMGECEETLFQLLAELRPVRRRSRRIGPLFLLFVTGVAGLGFWAQRVGRKENATLSPRPAAPLSSRPTPEPPMQALPLDPTSLAVAKSAAAPSGPPGSAPKKPRPKAPGKRRQPLDPLADSVPILGRD